MTIMNISEICVKTKKEALQKLEECRVMEKDAIVYVTELCENFVKLGYIVKYSDMKMIGKVVFKWEA